MLDHAGVSRHQPNEVTVRQAGQSSREATAQGNARLFHYSLLYLAILFAAVAVDAVGLRLRSGPPV